MIELGVIDMTQVLEGEPTFIFANVVQETIPPVIEESNAVKVELIPLILMVEYLEMQLTILISFL